MSVKFLHLHQPDAVDYSIYLLGDSLTCHYGKTQKIESNKQKAERMGKKLNSNSHHFESLNLTVKHR